MGPISATLEGKRFHNYLQLGANIDNVGPRFRRARVQHRGSIRGRPPLSRSSRTSSGRPRCATPADAVASTPRSTMQLSGLRMGSATSWSFSPGRRRPSSKMTTSSDPDEQPLTCVPNGNQPTPKGDLLGTDATAMRSELRRTEHLGLCKRAVRSTPKEGKTHYKAFIGARATSTTYRVAPRRQPRARLPERLGQPRRLLQPHLLPRKLHPVRLQPVPRGRLLAHRASAGTGAPSSPTSSRSPWNEGENLLALNWAPHFSFIFGYRVPDPPGSPAALFQRRHSVPQRRTVRHLVRPCFSTRCASSSVSAARRCAAWVACAACSPRSRAAASSWSHASDRLSA